MSIQDHIDKLKQNIKSQQTTVDKKNLVKETMRPTDIRITIKGDYICLDFETETKYLIMSLDDWKRITKTINKSIA